LPNKVFNFYFSLEEIENLFNSRENGKRLWKEKEDFRREKVAEV